MTLKKKSLPMIGWREWINLPTLGIKHIKAKIDTGARTSALHAFNLSTFIKQGKLKITFDIHPVQDNNNKIITCQADVFGQKLITDSGGHREMRYVIHTIIQLGRYIWPIEVTLTQRHSMRHRMLLGRAAIYKRFTINPAKSFLQKTKKEQDQKKDL